MCAICNEKKILFTIDLKGKSAKACSDCITDNFLTGWSK